MRTAGGNTLFSYWWLPAKPTRVGLSLLLPKRWARTPKRSLTGVRPPNSEPPLHRMNNWIAPKLKGLGMAARYG